MMVDLDLISLEKQFIDGTKIEANAYKYSFVWKKLVEKNIAIDSQKLEEKIQAINQNTKTAFLSKKQKKTVEKLEKEQFPKLQEYEKHLENPGERNSYSKIDTDAAFMRMEEDHIKNGQLKSRALKKSFFENTIKKRSR